jgi:hypothetical protein
MRLSSHREHGPKFPILKTTRARGLSVLIRTWLNYSCRGCRMSGSRYSGPAAILDLSPTFPLSSDLLPVPSFLTCPLTEGPSSLRAVLSPRADFWEGH